MYRYFLHHLSDWPLRGAVNPEPFGPDIHGDYLATVDASDPHCLAYEQDMPELSRADAAIWGASLPPVQGVPVELRPVLYGDEPEPLETSDSIDTEGL